MKLSQGHILVLFLNFGIKLQTLLSKHTFYSNFFLLFHFINILFQLPL